MAPKARVLSVRVTGSEADLELLAELCSRLTLQVAPAPVTCKGRRKDGQPCGWRLSASHPTALCSHHKNQSPSEWTRPA